MENSGGVERGGVDGEGRRWKREEEWRRRVERGG